MGTGPAPALCDCILEQYVTFPAACCHGSQPCSPVGAWARGRALCVLSEPISNYGLQLKWLVCLPGPGPWTLDPKGPWTLLDGQTLPGTPAASPALPLIWCLQSQLCTPTSVHPPKSLRKVVFQLPPAVYFALKPTYKFNQTLLH